MSILSGSAIERELERGHILIEPFNANHVGPNSYDLTLAPDLLMYNRHRKPDLYLNEIRFILDMKKEPVTEKVTIPESGYVLEPGILYLGSTVERAGSDHYVPMIDGRSSIGRLGLQVHITAGRGDVGFKGRWTLEMTVVQPLRIYPGVRIAQVWFLTVEGLVRQYQGKYQGQEGVEASKLYKDFQKET